MAWRDQSLCGRVSRRACRPSTTPTPNPTLTPTSTPTHADDAAAAAATLPLRWVRSPFIFARNQSRSRASSGLDGSPISRTHFRAATAASLESEYSFSTMSTLPQTALSSGPSCASSSSASSASSAAAAAGFGVSPRSGGGCAVGDSGASLRRDDDPTMESRRLPTSISLSWSSACDSLAAGDAVDFCVRRLRRRKKSAVAATDNTTTAARGRWCGAMLRAPVCRATVPQPPPPPEARGERKGLILKSRKRA